jgi:hypothetical protein
MGTFIKALSVSDGIAPAGDHPASGGGFFSSEHSMPIATAT